MDDRQRVDGVIRPPAIPIRQGVEDWLRVDDADSPEVVHEEEAPPVVANLSQAVSDVRVKLRLVPVGYMEWVAAAPLINVSGEGSDDDDGTASGRSQHRLERFVQIVLGFLVRDYEVPLHMVYTVWLVIRCFTDVNKFFISLTQFFYLTTLLNFVLSTPQAQGGGEAQVLVPLLRG